MPARSRARCSDRRSTILRTVAPAPWLRPWAPVSPPNSTESEPVHLRSVPARPVVHVHDVVDPLVGVLIVVPDSHPANDADRQPRAVAPLQPQVAVHQLLIADLAPARDILATLARVPRVVFGPLVIGVA